MDWLRQRAQVTPHKVALIFESKHWTYAELDGMTDAVCTQLLEAGAEAGQMVAMLMPATETAVCLVHAAARLNMILVPLNLRLTTTELNWQLENTEADWLAVDREQGSGFGDRKHSACKTLIIEKPQLPITHYQSLDKAQDKSPHLPILPSPNPQFPQSIIFTSGTTGHPKGVMLTFENHFWSANASAYRLGVSPNDRWVSCLPLYHVGGLAVIFRSCLYGTAVILHQKFDLTAINHSLDVHGGTLISVVPTMLFRLMDSRDYWPDTLRLILVGGAAASPELVERANRMRRQKGEGRERKLTNNRQWIIDNDQSLDKSPNLQSPPLVSTSYGLTEAASQVATQTPEDTIRKPGSVGKPLMFSSLRVVDENGRSLPPNQIGEIVVSGPTVMQGYFANEQATAQTLQNGELYSGDMGYLDDDGDLWLVQRRSDIIVSGGENVYPAEVEKVLKAHPHIDSICVVGAPHAEWGDIVTAMVVLVDGYTLAEEELLEYGRKHLAGYKQPRHIQFVDTLPLTGSGKIHRKKVKELMTKSVT